MLHVLQKDSGILGCWLLLEEITEKEQRLWSSAESLGQSSLYDQLTP